MKRVLRSVIDFHTPSANSDALMVNYQRLRSSNLEFNKPDDRRILQFISEFAFNNLGEVPSVETIRDFFEKDGEVLERLKDLEKESPYTRANFAYLLRELVEEHNRLKVVTLLKDTQTIVEVGLSLGEGKKKQRLKGISDGVRYFNDQIYDLTPTDYNVQTEGDVRGDAEIVVSEYETAKANKDKVYGRFSGIEHIDSVCKGLRRGELWIHAAFPGELKSMFALNWAYNLVTRYRSNVFYNSFEMPYPQVRKIIYAIHSANRRFESAHPPLDYRKIRDGELSPTEEEFFRHVAKDFNENPEYCRFELWCPDRDVTVEDIRMKAEAHHREWEVGFTVLDYLGLMQPKTHDREYTIRLNSIVRDAKKFALHFNGGEGMPVLGLFQINRQGKKEADKAEGEYRLDALSYANETEKSADTITTTYLNEDLRERGRSVCCCLKNRDNPLFDRFELGVNFTCRRIYQTELTERVGNGMEFTDADDAALEAIGML